MGLAYPELRFMKESMSIRLDMEVFRILILCVSAACVYGIVHDQVTARVCVEYFTIGHPPIFGGTQSPTLLAFGWGIIATWWVGLPLGLLLSAAARIGPMPKWSWRKLVRPLAVTLALMGICALVAGVAGYQKNQAQALGAYHGEIPPERWALFMADYWAHLSSYATGVLGGFVLCAYVVAKRYMELMHAKERSALPHA